MRESSTQGRKRLGLVLQEAGLITPAQLEVAVNNQKHFDYLIGEVIALHGWVAQDTVEFFAEQWFNLIHRPNPLPLGHYLQMADLLNQGQIGEILVEQKKMGLRFGATAVLMGCLKQQTVDYFIAHLKAEMAFQSPFTTHELAKSGVERIRQAKTTQRDTQREKENDSQGEEFDKNGQARVVIGKSIIRLPAELVGELPDNFDIFATDDENFDLANVLSMEDDNISL